jgi:ATP adenylyltransferase
VIEDGGIRFAVRVLEAPRNKPKRSAPGNPFLPYEEALHVADVSETHVCLLNKYPVLPHHALLVTREFEDQEQPLSRNDFEAAWLTLAEIDGLVFYNAGELAGASQRHRHLQWVPTPLGDGEARTPIDTALAKARFTENVGRTDALPFLHGIARLRNDRASTGEIATILHGLYKKMAGAFACDRAGRPYNLLLTRDWMLLVPRRAAKWGGVSINALGFAGALLAKSEKQLRRLREAGPLTALRHTAINLAG